MARFSDINRADELKLAATALNLWRGRSRAEKAALYATATAVGEGKRLNRGSKIAFIQPFGAPDNFWYETKVLAPATASPTAKEENVPSLIAAVVSAVQPYISAVLPVGPTNMATTAKKIQFAKVMCTEKGTATFPTTSRMTGRPYVKMNSNTASCPFGAIALLATQPVVVKIIRTTLMPATPVAGRSVGFTSQGNVGNIIAGTP